MSLSATWDCTAVVAETISSHVMLNGNQLLSHAVSCKIGIRKLKTVYKVISVL